MQKLTAWLSPTGRKTLYAILGALGAILTTLGITDQVAVDSWLGIANAALGVLAVVVAALNAKRLDYKALYLALGAAIVAFTAAGIFNDGQASHIYDIMAQLFVAIPLVTAFLRTNTTVPTGEPITEYVAPTTGTNVVPSSAGDTYVPAHGGGVEQVEERGQVNVQSGLTMLVLVLLAIALVIFIVDSL